MADLGCPFVDDIAEAVGSDETEAEKNDICVRVGERSNEAQKTNHIIKVVILLGPLLVALDRIFSKTITAQGGQKTTINKCTVLFTR